MRIRTLSTAAACAVIAIDRDPDAIARGGALQDEFGDRLTLCEGPAHHARGHPHRADDAQPAADVPDPATQPVAVAVLEPLPRDARRTARSDHGPLTPTTPARARTATVRTVRRAASTTP